MQRNAGGGARRGPGARIGLCLALAGLILALFPPFAAAITAKPLFGTVSATPSSGGATLTGTVYPYGLDTHYHFEYGTTTSYGTNVPMPEGDLGAAEYPTTAQAQQTVSGLSGTYHYRLVASNSAGTTMSTDQTFTTTGPPPTVVSDPATETASGFTLSGTVNPNGSATTYQIRIRNDDGLRQQHPNHRSLRRVGLERGGGEPGSHRPAAEPDLSFPPDRPQQWNGIHLRPDIHDACAAPGTARRRC